MRFLALLLLALATYGVNAQQILFDRTIPEQNVAVDYHLKNEIRSYYTNSHYVIESDFLSRQDFFTTITANFNLIESLKTSDGIYL